MCAGIAGRALLGKGLPVGFALGDAGSLVASLIIGIAHPFRGVC
jgi:hypothetical protein